MKREKCIINHIISCISNIVYGKPGLNLNLHVMCCVVCHIWKAFTQSWNFLALSENQLCNSLETSLVALPAFYGLTIAAFSVARSHSVCRLLEGEVGVVRPSPLERCLLNTDSQDHRRVVLPSSALRLCTRIWIEDVFHTSKFFGLLVASRICYGDNIKNDTAWSPSISSEGLQLVLKGKKSFLWMRDPQY